MFPPLTSASLKGQRQIDSQLTMLNHKGYFGNDKTQGKYLNYYLHVIVFMNEKKKKKPRQKSA